MAKLHKTFESFLTAWEHKGEFAQTLFAKRFFCRKLYVSTGTMPPKMGLHRRLKNACTGNCGGNFNDAVGAGSHGMGSHSLQSGAWCSLVQNARTEKLEIKAVVQVYRSLFCLSVLLDMRKRGFGKWFVKWQ
ncbi:MAG: hypothetical protein ACLVJH_09645 [Faecalibacterium prausnitzii]